MPPKKCKQQTQNGRFVVAAVAAAGGPRRCPRHRCLAGRLGRGRGGSPSCGAPRAEAAAPTACGQGWQPAAHTAVAIFVVVAAAGGLVAPDVVAAAGNDDGDDGAGEYVEGGFPAASGQELPHLPRGRRDAGLAQ